MQKTEQPFREQEKNKKIEELLQIAVLCTSVKT